MTKCQRIGIVYMLAGMIVAMGSIHHTALADKMFALLLAMIWFGIGAYRFTKD